VRGRDGCLEGVLKLLLLTALFDWLEDNFGFGRGCSCSGIGCGFLILIVFLFMACSVVTGTDWFSLF
jgi:hypothetical protein